MGNVFNALAIFMVTVSPVFAGPINPVPEPETLALLAVGAVAAMISLRRKNKK